VSSDQQVAGDVPRGPAATNPPDEAVIRLALETARAAELERVLGPDHPDTLNARNNLAAAYQAAGRAADAIPLFEHTLVARERVLGPNHPDTLSSQNDLAATYQDASRHAEALLMFKLTLAARERLLGTDHPSTLNSRGNLAAAYRAAGRVSEAIPLLEQTLAGRDRALGAGHPDVQAARDNLAAARRETERTDQELPAAPSAGDAPPEPVPEPSVAAPAAEKVADVVPEPAPVPEPEPAPVPEPEPEPEAPVEVSEPAPAPAVESPAAPAAVEPPAAPVAGPPAPSRDRPARRLRHVLSLVAAVGVLLTAGGAAAALFRSYSEHSSHRPATASRPAERQSGSTASQLAAAWVAQQVTRSAIVACDPLMCAALEAQGVSAARLLVLRAGTTSPLGALVVVVTPAIRSQFGSRLDSMDAASQIAGFGSGPDRVSVQVIAKNGPAAYQAALRQDVTARKAAGAQLLANKRITAPAAVAAELAAGAVDARLLIMLPALAAVHPIQIRAVGHPVPGASPGVPLCSAELSGSGRAAGMSNASYLSWLTSFVRAQLAPFQGSMTVLSEAGQPVVRVVFAQPSPLGLLAPA
jgi:outer membrane biosynthesis protein TonB